MINVQSFFISKFRNARRRITGLPINHIRTSSQKQEKFNRAWKKVNDEEAAAGETDEGVLEGAIKCMMKK